MSLGETEGRREQIDSLRAVAVTAVLYTHFWNDNNAFGTLGVQLFFVISGYLITGILLGIRRSAELESVQLHRGLLNFYVRRALRIWPIYYAALALALLIEHQRIVQSLPWHILFASNILFASKNAWDPWFTAHFWSLSVEEQFYILWAPFILFLPRQFLHGAILVVILIGIVFSATATIVHLDNPGIGVLMPGALGTLGVGALLALDEGRWKWPAWMSYAAAVAAIFWLIANTVTSTGDGNVFVVALSNTLVLISLAGVTLSARRGMRGPIGSVLSSGPLCYIGRISYGIYVYHLILFGIVLTYLPGYFQRGVLTFVVLGSATVAIAALSWAFIEKPILRLKDNFPYRAVQRSPA